MYDRIAEREPESDIEKAVSAYAEKRGWMVVKLMICNVDSMPDRLLMRKGRVIFIEFKKPGETPTPKQAKRHREIRAQGIEVFAVDNEEEGNDIVR